MQHIDPEHHDGTSDATPGGVPGQRRPGELVFALLMLGGSLALLWEAYGISGFQALSAPGTVPMAVTAVMVLTAGIVAVRTARLPRVAGETVTRDILPWRVVLFAGLLLAYGLLLRPLGFLPTSALFLVVSIKVLARRGWGWTLAVSVFTLLVIWVVFRVVFTVLLPPGIVPEGEILQIFRNLAGG